MRKGLARVACLGLVVLLAGCGGAPAKDGAPGGDAPGEEASDGAQGLPTWAVGDYWTYTFNGAPTTYVITGATASDWIMETDSLERSFSDLRDDVSRLGPQRKADLAGSQGSDRVEFFRWPLANGMPDWTTTWDHQAVTVHVLGVNPGFVELEARLTNATPADPPLYKYVYDDTVRWFRQLTHYAPDGSEIVNLELTASGHNWTGQVAHWALVTILHESGDLGPPLSMSNAYDVPLTATDVWVDAAVHCSAGAVQAGTSPFPFGLSITGQDGRGGGASGQPCPSDEEFIGSAGAPKASAQGGTAETWGYALVASAGAVGTYRLEILVRTLTMMPFGT